VDLPWSICAMMQKFRMNRGSISACAVVNQRGKEAPLHATARARRLSNYRVCHTSRPSASHAAHINTPSEQL
jgi:hypothetical protein